MKIARRLLTVLIIAVAVVNTGCDGDSATSGSNAITTAQDERTSAADAKTDTPARIAQAQVAYEEAVRLGFGWTTTPALIDDAKRALHAGNGPEAAVFAQRALLEAEAAVQQAKYSDEHWQALIPR